MKKLITAALLLSSALVSVGAQANEAEDLYYTALDQYAARADLAQNDKAIETLNLAASKTTDKDLTFQIQVLLSRANYWKGLNSQGDANKVAVFRAGMNAGAKAIDAREDLAEGYYFYAVNLARWGESNGIMSSVGKLPELRDSLYAAEQRPTFEGGSGSEYDGYGVNRVRGRVIDKVPGPVRALRGWRYSNADGLAFLKDASEKAANVFLNGQYYAEMLLGSGRRDEACAVLSKLMTQDPATANADRIAENTLEMADIKAINARSCN